MLVLTIINTIILAAVCYKVFKPQRVPTVSVQEIKYAQKKLNKT